MVNIIRIEVIFMAEVQKYIGQDEKIPQRGKPVYLGSTWRQIFPDQYRQLRDKADIQHPRSSRSRR